MPTDSCPVSERLDRRHAKQECFLFSVCEDTVVDCLRLPATFIASKWLCISFGSRKPTMPRTFAVS